MSDDSKRAITKMYRYIVSDADGKTSTLKADIVDVTNTGALVGYIFPNEGAGSQEMVWAISPSRWLAVDRVD